jgi:hypothetical protein
VRKAEQERRGDVSQAPVDIDEIAIQASPAAGEFDMRQ